MVYTDFSLTLFKEVLKNLTNDYDDNVNTYTSAHHEDIYFRLKKTAKLIKNIGLLKNTPRQEYSNLLENIEPYFLNIFNFYKLLEDEDSKDLLIKLLAYRILGHRKYKLPLNNDRYWEQFRKLEQATNSKNYINIDYRDWKLSQFEIINNEQNIKLYYVPIGILDTFIVKQYECPVRKQIKAKEGNIVIDAGGCWGDTALYFASEVGQTGKVYTFEFIPSNLKLLKKNIESNPALQKRIEIVERPLWSESDKIMYYSDNGPASFVSFEKKQNNITEEVLTVSIDEFVKKNNVERVDFIKMDIEGAELSALKGAINVISNSRPILAISIYHSLDDFIRIPEFIHSLDLGYKFYLGHFTIHLEETVLYAMSDA